MTTNIRMVVIIKCQRCGNIDKNYFHLGSKGFYCRKCIRFRRLLVEDNLEVFNYSIQNNADYELGFKLTDHQKKCSRELLEVALISDCVVHAVCGAGKTEIVLPLIAQYLKNNKKVAFTIPRKQVVLQLGQRLQSYFSRLKVITVCEGSTDILVGDLIVCTTHQLFRYHKAFDLLIIDEPDAYPYSGDVLLGNIATNSCRGRKVYLTATPDHNLQRLPQIKLFKRPHGFPLPEPLEILVFFPFLQLLKWIRSQRHSLIFVPTIALARSLSKLLRLPCLHSQTLQKEEIINDFSSLKYRHLICTTILERGVTFVGIDILVYLPEHRVFDKASLIQIAGRAGRSPKAPTGEVWFVSKQKTGKVKDCIQTIKIMNV